MSYNGIADDYKDKLKEQIEKLTEKLVSGNAKSFEEYKSLCAQIGAYRDADKRFVDVVRSYLREEK